MRNRVIVHLRSMTTELYVPAVHPCWAAKECPGEQLQCGCDSASAPGVLLSTPNSVSFLVQQSKMRRRDGDEAGWGSSTK